MKQSVIFRHLTTSWWVWASHKRVQNFSALQTLHLLMENLPGVWFYADMKAVISCATECQWCMYGLYKIMLLLLHIFLLSAHFFLVGHRLLAPIHSTSKIFCVVFFMFIRWKLSSAILDCFAGVVTHGSGFLLGIFSFHASSGLRLECSSWVQCKRWLRT